MRSKFDEQLKELNDEMIQMGNMVEQAIQNTIKALFAQDTQQAKRIMNEDDLVDQKQKTIENICFHLLIQQQPVASDLRTITAALKMVTDMERIGDHAADISELTVMMAGSPYQLQENHIKHMASEATVMLLRAVSAYVERDVVMAREVIAHDDIVDDLFVLVKGELLDVIRKHPDYSEQAVDLLMVIKYLERIGDHATNIAEWVIFALEDNIGHVQQN